MPHCYALRAPSPYLHPSVHPSILLLQFTSSSFLLSPHAFSLTLSKSQHTSRVDSPYNSNLYHPHLHIFSFALAACLFFSFSLSFLLSLFLTSLITLSKMRYDDFETSIKVRHINILNYLLILINLFTINIFKKQQKQPQIVVVGNGIVGKSSMIQRYCCGFFSSEYKKTIGVDFLERIIR